MSVESDLAAARHGMSVLWTEITAGREHAAQLLNHLRQAMSVHDDTKSLIAEMKSLFETIKGEQGNSDAAIQDLKDEATALRDEMKAFAASMSGASASGSTASASTSFTGNTAAAS